MGHEDVSRLISLVRVEHCGFRLDGDAAGSHAPAYYTFDSNLKLLSAEVGRDYVQLHKRFEREGRVRHAYTQAEEQKLMPVFEWTGEGFAPIDQRLTSRR